ncbi:tyrosine-type recombinase/integrase [Sphingomonas piscis]|uniref:Tyrosine-type recombinase/integrase n=1 Tax=Sphingomonas piscis TaxID=2714943 RepID=A0A6G7YPH9_9SPHN|nr:tyrosine-type recombinase/integrase [Sphingomonas piscis]
MPRFTDQSVRSIKPPITGQAEHADDLVQGLRLRVGAGGRKAWIVRTRVAGKPTNKKLGTFPVLGVAEARTAARTFLAMAAQQGPGRANHSFGELAKHWIDHVARVKNKSWRNQERRIEIYLLPVWKDRELSSIRRSDVRDLVDGIEGEVAPGRALAMAKTLFRYALTRDWIDASPADGIPAPRADTPRDRFLRMDEVHRVYIAADLLGYPFAGFIKMLLLTGQRRTEVAAMRWDQIDLDTSSWILSREETKSARQHLVPLSQLAREVLRATPRLGPYVWTSDGQTHVKGFSKAKAALDRFLASENAGDIKPWRLHDLRRSVATHLVRLGTSEVVVGRILNHAARGVTARTYALHSYEPEKRKALEQWSAEILRLLPQS